MAGSFEDAYFDGADPVDVESLSAADREALARSHRELAARRPLGTARVRVSNPSRATDGWESPHTVVDIVTDDMPFIVDSVIAFLAQGGFEVYRLLHPVIDGESFVHVEIPRESDVAALEALAQSIASVLDDVRAAVSDWEAMRERVRSLADSWRSAPPLPASTDDIPEVVAFLDWLVDDHFTFVGAGDERAAEVLGVARRRVPAGLPGVDESRVLTLTKARERSTVHRAVPLDYVGVARVDGSGAVAGHEWFVGLYTADVYSASPSELPIVRRKTAEVARRTAYPPSSHDARALANVLATFPRDELFRLSLAELIDTSLGIVRLGERRTVRLFVTIDPWHRFASCLVYLPRDRYTTSVRVAILDALRRAFHGTDLDFTVNVTESVLARLHVVVQMDAAAQVDEATLERELADIARAWTDELRDALIADRGEELGLDAFKVWGEAFPPAYQADVAATEAVRDIGVLETGDELAIRLVVGKDDQATRLDLYHRGGPLLLSDVMPLLEHLDVTVVDERPYAITPDGAPSSFIYSFGVRPSSEEVLLDASTQARLSELFRAVWAGDAENDALNALVLRAGLTARQVTFVRALVKYLHQAGLRFTEEALAGALSRNPHATRLLVDVFESRFDPDLFDGDAGRREQRAGDVHRDLLRAIDDVVTLDDDRVLRALTEVVVATVRTNAYQGGARSVLALKIDPAAVSFLPAPRPEHEIWVYSPRVEGVHLRGGDVARGGIRWSDRRDDFRTEVLGLMKAQMEKNAVIVPAGAKGGFVVKQPPAEDVALRTEVLACYQTFVGALLDLTDNIVDGRVVAPVRTVLRDGDDPYLVVAADRGTAGFSDVANALALERNYWLGDAFASGGSSGYDHKAMAITSRGAWISVRAHFRAVGIDADTAPLTVVGIGDMSGDVFGNGLLRSRHLKLIAAFDHRHVFLDPDPDPEVSFRERQRLFELPRSSWAEYDPALLSRGGGVFARGVKACGLSPEARRALGIGDDVTALTPDELIAAILRAPVDLLWNGGIGTFVKASTESDADVADRANDGVRIDGNELRCKVVAEGGNLGLTQLARVEYALTPSPFRDGAGGRVNTDAIDNSAGVDSSDHEVNIKIVLRDAIAAGRLAADDRVPLLVEMTDEVAALVLADNEAQTNALEIAAVEAPDMVGVHARQIERLEQAGLLDRRLEGLPGRKALQERHAAGLGLTSPELAILLAFTKLNLERALLASDVPDDPYFRRDLLAYFPSALRERFPDLIEAHVLRREIVSTVVANAVVNRAGISFLARVADESGATLPSLARAHVLARDIFGMTETWAAIDELDLKVPAATQDFMFLAARRVVERGARWLIRHEPDLALEPTLERYRAPVASLLADLPDLLGGDAAAEFATRHDRLLGDGVPVALAYQIATFDRAHDALAIAAIAQREGTASVDDVARVHFTIADRLRLDWLRDHIAALPRGDRWQIEARAALRDDVSDLHALLTEDVLRTTDAQLDAASRVAQWVRVHADAAQRHASLLADIETGGVYDLATLGSARRELRDLAGLTPD